LLPLPEDQVSTISGISKLDEWELLEKYDIYRGVQEAKERARHKSESRNIIKAELDK
jgi:signal transduction histidine kinase